MQVLNNAPAFAVWTSYSSNVANLRKSMSKLSSGLKIQTAADDPAGLAISQRLRIQASNSAAAQQDIQNGLSYVQTADSWLQKMHDILGRMGELAVGAKDDTKSATDKANLQTEFGQMQAELQRIATSGKYNGVAMFTSATGVGVQVGPDSGQTFTISGMDLRNTSTASLTSTSTYTWHDVTNGTTTVSLSSTAGITAAISAVNDASDFISSKRATLGAQSSRLNNTLEGLRTYESNIRSAESQVRDVDMAKEVTTFSKYQILTQVGTAMLAQANQLPQNVLKLIQ